jgi:hypothetical protein
MDPLGANLMITEMVRAAAAHFPDVRSHPDAYSIGLNFKTGGWHLTTFRWEGAAWTAAVIVPRLVWTGVGAMLAVFAALPFDRFAGEGPLREAGRGGSGRRARRSGRVGTPSAGVAVDATVAAPARGPFDAAASSDHPVLASPHRGRALPGLIAAELRLLLAGLPIAWYLVPLALVVASAFVPHVAAGRVAAIAWGWPVLRWSALGARDRRHGTEALLLSSPRPITRQLAASWIAGLVLALGMGAGVALRAALAGDLATLAGVVSGAAFVPALALALGTWTGSTKTFEVLYLVLWYGGPLNGIPFLDFTGGAGAGPAAGFAIAAALLLALAALGRQRRLLT